MRAPLVVNVPGSPRGALESLEAIVPVLEHALETLAGPFDHGRATAGGARPDLPAPSRRLRCSTTFATVPAYPLVFPLFWGAVIVFGLVMARHLRIFAAVRAEGPSPFSDVPRRTAGLVRYALIQTRMFKDRRAGLMHFGDLLGLRPADDRDGQRRHRRPGPGGHLVAVRRAAVDARARRCRTSWRSSSSWRSARPSSGGW